MIEQLPHRGAYSVTSTVGRSRGYVDCPFCGRVVAVYVWSLAGGGKRCECGALLAPRHATRTHGGLAPGAAPGLTDQGGAGSGASCHYPDQEEPCPVLQ